MIKPFQSGNVSWPYGKSFLVTVFIAFIFNSTKEHGHGKDTPLQKVEQKYSFIMAKMFLLQSGSLIFWSVKQ